MSDDQRQGEKASAEDGEEEQGQVVFYKTRTEGERSGASTRAPLVSVDTILPAISFGRESTRA
jgi:hypothetical protein